MKNAPLLIFALSSLALAGCTHKPSIVGKWQGSTTTPQGGALISTFDFTQDGKETVSFQASGGPISINMGGSGTYTADGANLTQNITSMTMGSMTMPIAADKAKPQTSPYTLDGSHLPPTRFLVYSFLGPRHAYTLDGDHLTLTSPTNSQSLALTRVKE